MMNSQETTQRVESFIETKSDSQSDIDDLNHSVDVGIF